ncbi:DUF6792 domain-containing protein [Bacillus thuringiensis]|uniref:DUF6792 domain-containing protein n=1 Tax=Bacillus thuringiensis TaxID=1428 RepID=UPI0036EDE89D
MQLVVKMVGICITLLLMLYIGMEVKINQPSSEKISDSFLAEDVKMLKFSYLSYLNLGDNSSYYKDNIRTISTNSDLFMESELKKFKDELKVISPEENYMDNFLSDLDGWKVYLAEGDKGDFLSTLGFWAVAYKKDNNVVISFRGTDDLSSISYDIAAIILQTDTDTQTQLAKEFLKKVHEKIQKEQEIEPINVNFTGHSLGGYIAQRITLDIYNDKIPGYSVNGMEMKLNKTVTFNAPGFKKNFLLHIQETITNNQYNDSKNYRVRNYINSVDVVGQFGKHLGENLYIDGSKKLFESHSLLHLYKDINYKFGVGKKPLLIVLIDGTLRDYESKRVLEQIIFITLGVLGQSLPYVILCMIVINLCLNKFHTPQQPMNIGHFLNYALLFLIICIFLIVYMENIIISILCSVSIIVLLWFYLKS